MKVLHPGHDLIFFYNGHVDIDQLQSYKEELIIINCASEHWGSDSTFLLNICKDLEHNNFNFWVLSFYYKDHLKHPRLIYYPWWYIYGYKKFEDVDILLPRTKLFGCLNGNPRIHKIANYFALQEKFDIEKFHISIYNAEKMAQRDDDDTMTELEEKQWKSLSVTLLNCGPIVSDSTIIIPALDDAYIHLTIETTVIDRIFISEKTWKPIAAGQLFLQFGNPGTVKLLRLLGVDTFDDIIDHDSYDNIQNWRQRMERIHSIMRDLEKQDIERIWAHTQHRRELNKQRFFAGKYSLPYQHTVLDPLLEPYVLRR